MLPIPRGNHMLLVHRIHREFGSHLSSVFQFQHALSRKSKSTVCSRFLIVSLCFCFSLVSLSLSPLSLANLMYSALLYLIRIYIYISF